MLAVRLENLPESSRWYPGAGLYRNVHIITVEDAYIPVWGTYITTPVVNENFAKINVRTEVQLPENADPNHYWVETVIQDSLYREIHRIKTSLSSLPVWRHPFLRVLLSRAPLYGLPTVRFYIRQKHICMKAIL